MHDFLLAGDARFVTYHPHMATATSQTEQPQANFALMVKVSLLERGLTVTKLAKQLRFARNTVSLAINHPTMLPSVKKRIRKELGLAA